jgi:hypothetical protein
MMDQWETGKHMRPLETHQHVLVMTPDANVNGREVRVRSASQTFKYICVAQFSSSPTFLFVFVFVFVFSFSHLPFSFAVSQHLL